LFDRVILDAPSSELGLISRDSTIKLKKTKKDVLKCAEL
jgi:16S rRNA C967 or C1407 C5-methylase (RsmB/RsmF family)